MARKRTAAKRASLTDAAQEIFRRDGFEGATMEAIAAAAGCSKATLYGYFASKEELFLAVLELSVDRQASAIIADVREGPCLAEGLNRFAVAYLTRTLSDTVTANRRSISNLPRGPGGLAAQFYDRGLRAAFVKLSEQIKAIMDAGELQSADAWVATMHLKGLIEQDLVDRRVLGASEAPGHDVIARAALEGVEAFLRAYAPGRSEGR